MEVSGSVLDSMAHDDDDKQQQSGTVVTCPKVCI